MELKNKSDALWQNWSFRRYSIWYAPK